MSSKGLVLITGATGHIGFKTLLDLLEAGYQARIAVRSEAKTKAILDNPKFKSLQIPSNSYTFTIVPEITAKDAYHDAIKGVDYVMHIASPLTGGEMTTTEEYQKHFIEPAVEATSNILETAKTELNVKRVVITSSVIALLPFKDVSRPHASDEWFYAENRTVNDEGPYANKFQAYSASKIKSLNESEAWMKSNNPHFDLVNIHPSFVMGRNDLSLTLEAMFHGSNRMMLNVVKEKEFKSAIQGSTVHNDDVARLHVESLQQSKIPAGSYIATGPASRWEDIPTIVRKLYPNAVEDGALQDNAKVVTIPSNFGSKKTEETFGWKLQGFDAQVASVVGYYLEVLDAANKNDS